MRSVSTLMAFLLLQSVAAAGIIEGGKGMLFGSDHAFFATAGAGWVLDNQSGVRQGLHMVFYPSGRTWSDSPVIVYGRAVSKHQVPTIASQVQRTIGSFQKKGSLDYAAERQPPITLSNGKSAELYHFSGDKWGNHEAAVYYDEDDSINFLIYNARKKHLFDRYLDDFLRIARTYANTYTPSSALSSTQLGELAQESREDLALPGARTYKTKAMRAVGEQMACFMRDCTTYSSSDESAFFHLFTRIDGDGLAVELSTYPTNALTVCFKGMMSGVKYPPHGFDTFLLEINMRVTE